MFRTRDFLLLLVVVAFLVMAIVYTAADRLSTPTNSQVVPQLTSSEIADVTATINDQADGGLTREERLAQLKEKVQAAPVPEEIIDTASEAELTETAVASSSPAVTDPLRCTTFDPTYAPYWPLGEVEQYAVEGVRQYRISRDTLAVGTTSSSSVETTVLLSLPMSFLPVGVPSCLNSPVIGVAVDGSLIRNNEADIYRIFSEETLVGYALDGFPIYGQTSNALDECGGRIKLGQYRYELRPDAPDILNCFSGIPQTFFDQDADL